MDSNIPDYGKIISKAREKKQITQSELGKLIGVGKSMISNYETNYITPNIKTLEKIAYALGYSILDMLALDDSADADMLNLPRSIQPSNDKYIRYLSGENICREKIFFDSYMDSYITLPGIMLNSDDKYLCVKIPDNSMKDCDLTKNDYAIIRQTDTIINGAIVLAVSHSDSLYVIRRYFRENHFVTLSAVSDTEIHLPLTYDERDKDFIIVGYVEKVLKNI